MGIQSGDAHYKYTLCSVTAVNQRDRDKRRFESKAKNCHTCYLLLSETYATVSTLVMVHQSNAFDGISSVVFHFSLETLSSKMSDQKYLERLKKVIDFDLTVLQPWKSGSDNKELSPL